MQIKENISQTKYETAQNISFSKLRKKTIVSEVFFNSFQMAAKKKAKKMPAKKAKKAAPKKKVAAKKRK